MPPLNSSLVNSNLNLPVFPGTQIPANQFNAVNRNFSGLESGFRPQVNATLPLTPQPKQKEGAKTERPEIGMLNLNTVKPNTGAAAKRPTRSQRAESNRNNAVAAFHKRQFHKRQLLAYDDSHLKKPPFDKDACLETNRRAGDNLSWGYPTYRNKADAEKCAPTGNYQLCLSWFPFKWGCSTYWHFNPGSECASKQIDLGGGRFKKKDDVFCGKKNIWYPVQKEPDDWGAEHNEVCAHDGKGGITCR